MTALLISLVVTAILIGLVVWYGKRREPGRYLTWGEAFVAAIIIFFVFLLCYGIVPNQWLQFADKDLKWRSDKIGVPMGPLHDWIGIGNSQGLLWGKGIPLSHGHFIITAQVIRDLVASLFYIVFGLVHIGLWLWWQKRGQVKATTPELEASAYGRPLVRKA